MAAPPGTLATPPTTSPISPQGATRQVLKGFLPATLLGLVGLLVFELFSTLFASIYALTPGATPTIFSNGPFMAVLGFTVGFVGWLGIVFEELI